MKTTKKKTSRKIYVKTIDGEKLQLKRDRLTQLTHGASLPTGGGELDDMACFVTFKTIREATIGSHGLRVTFIRERIFKNCQHVDVYFLPARGALGCCVFDEKTFNKIMKAAGSIIRFGQLVAA